MILFKKSEMFFQIYSFSKFISHFLSNLRGRFDFDVFFWKFEEIRFASRKMNALKANACPVDF